ncbi:MAG TPA: hypothetical protein VHZ56_04020 [Devosia sp.]|jgi:hypothetical protein|nr:hypothetical protein [Devosia sp.]
MRQVVLMLFAAALGFGGVYAYAQTGQGGAPVAGTVAAACVIKGNISIPSGERIYHMPGQHYYTATIITPEKGERWFCSEADAVAAGWRKAGD